MKKLDAPKLSLIIAVYNKPDHLRLVLAACARQSFKDFEVVITDDGSGPAIRDVVVEAQHQYSFPVTHLWQEDKGWRKNIMLNSAIRAATTEYLVFIDGDCLPGKDFLLDHWNQREPDRILMGRRAEPSERWSKALTLERVRSGEFERYGWKEWLDSFLKKSSRFEDGIRMNSTVVRTLLLRDIGGMLGSNCSMWKKDLVAINGFDELYNGTGCGEDSDVQYRLSLIGVTGKPLRNLAIQYHIWHPHTEGSVACRERFEMVKTTNNPRCKTGLIHE